MCVQYWKENATGLHVYCYFLLYAMFGHSSDIDLYPRSNYFKRDNN